MQHNPYSLHKLSHKERAQPSTTKIFCNKPHTCQIYYSDYIILDNHKFSTLQLVVVIHVTRVEPNSFGAILT